MDSYEQSISDIFSGRKKYIIPAYQRLYSWNEDDCQKLWDDLVDFAISIWDFDLNDFSESSEQYFLGPVVLYQRDSNRDLYEIIDGQQRFTTILLLLRAAEKYLDTNKKDNETQPTVYSKIKSIFENDDKPITRLESKIALDDDKKEFSNILENGEVLNPEIKHKKQPRYARNFQFFLDQFEKHQSDFTTTMTLPKFLDCILDHCKILRITEKGSFDSALTIFSSLNDRGKPLSDSDIFKSEIYNSFRSANKEDEFLKRWKNIEEMASGTFNLSNGVVSDKIGYMNKLFEHFMYYNIAKYQIRDNNMMKLRKFFEVQKVDKSNTSNERYQLLHRLDILDDLENIAKFWSSVKDSDTSIFHCDDELASTILKDMSILSFSPNELSSYIVTVYFMKHHQRANAENYGSLNYEFSVYIDDPKMFDSFLKNIIGYFWMSTLVDTTGKTLKSESIKKMILIVNDLFTPNGELFDLFVNNNGITEEDIKNSLEENCFTNGYKMTYPMIVWWAYYEDFEHQSLLPNNIQYNVEHIYNVARQNNLGELPDGLCDSIGNKALLEETINKAAKGLAFDEKVNWYKGSAEHSKGKTNLQELLNIDENGKKKSFTETDIRKRKDKIASNFIEFLKDYDFLYK